ncbi:MAG: PhoH family protein [Gammaproteobacteria bacterium]|nr:PhoH family protein [Gammaproteobacteria bacterium]NNM14695.1 PhoH family protein [Gammaproteobacteria bacterium]
MNALPDLERSKSKKLFVLDTNVLMHDPTAIFRFDEHDIYLPMIVIEELDHGKKGLSEPARNVRQVSRFLDDLMRDIPLNDIKLGIPLPHAFSRNGKSEESDPGRLFFQTEVLDHKLPESLPGSRNDNNILATTLALKALDSSRQVILVSKDINLRIKATALGMHAEDYFNDKTLDDVDLLFIGTQELDEDFWEKHSKEMDSWQEEGKTFYRLEGPSIEDWHANLCLYDDDKGFEAVVTEIEKDDSAIIRYVNNYQKNDVWGINARNREQNFALNLLMDPEVDFVTVLGVAGTGKTLLTLAAGLAQTLDHNLYNEIIMTRVTVPLGNDIGFLPGTEEEKMEPWMGALMDNLEVLTQPQDGGSWGRSATNDLIRNRIKVRSLNFMRGRTFLNRYIIVDEAQNLTAKQMKALITRAGPGSKLICMGNIAQIDTPYLTETTSGLTYVVQRFKNWSHSGHITLLRGERSRLADYASEIL